MGKDQAPKAEEGQGQEQETGEQQAQEEDGEDEKEDAAQEEKEPPSEQQEEAEEPVEGAAFQFATANECTDCHKNYGEGKDYTLAASIKNIDGHPAGDWNKVQDCMMCHSQEGNELATVLHPVHLKGENYLNSYGDSCLACHGMAEAGEMVVKGLADVTLSAQVGKTGQAPEGEPVKQVTKSGCSDCHKNFGEGKDYTLAAEIKNIQGHPEGDWNALSDCMMCHAQGPMPFARILHPIHLTGEHYVQEYGDSCLTCHGIDEKGMTFVQGLQ